MRPARRKVANIFIVDTIADEPTVICRSELNSPISAYASCVQSNWTSYDTGNNLFHWTQGPTRRRLQMNSPRRRITGFSFVRACTVGSTVDDRCWRILLKNSTLTDAGRPPRSDEVGFCGSRLQIAVAGCGIGISLASFRRFWAMAAKVNSSRAPQGPRSRNRPSRRMRLRCANSISTFLRSRRD